MPLVSMPSASVSRVLKFGGVGLEDGAAVRRAVGLVRAYGGERPIVVVSAHAGVTGLLQRAAAAPGEWREVWDRLRIRHRTLLRELDLESELLDRHLQELRSVLERAAASGPGDPRLRDYVLSFGERMSARVVSAALRAEGLSAAPLDAFDLGLVGERRDGTFRPGLEAGERVRRALGSLAGIPVVTGFLATDRAGHVLTLGRSGSDLSAAWIAAAVGAAEVHLWKTVSGVLTADPRLVPQARHVAELGWDEALDLGVQGAEVLHPGAVEAARRAGVSIWLRDAREPEGPGTRLIEDGGPLGPRVLVHRPAVARGHAALDCTRDPSEQGISIIGRLRGRGVEPLFAQVSGTEIQVLLAEREDLAAVAEHAGLELSRGLASLAVVGPGVGADRELGASLARRVAGLGEAVDEAPAGAGPSSRLFLLPAAALGRVAQALHAAWFEAPSELRRALGSGS